MKLWKKKGKKDRRALYWYLTMLGIVSAFWALQGKIQLPSEIFQMPGIGTLKGTVRCTLISSVNDTQHLRMELAIPYKSRNQWVEIRKAVPRLKHEFMMSMQTKGLEEVVKRRDFNTLRSHLLRLINRHLKNPVEEIYFESFFVD